MTAELKKNLISEYQDYLSSVISGDLEDFCPQWALDHFMKDHFGEKYEENKEAVAFYKDHGCAVRDEFESKQNSLKSW